MGKACGIGKIVSPVGAMSVYRMLITAHGNSLRALVKHLENLSDEAVMQFNILTGIPLVYEFDNDLRTIAHY